MSQYPYLSRLGHLPRTLLGCATFLIILIIALAVSRNPASWAAPIAQAPNQTIPAKQLTHLPMVVSPLINGCDFYLYACNLTADYTDATMNYDWSPDGRTIAFYGNGGSVSGLYAMNEQGKNRRLLLELSNIDNIVYSPDGKMIALIATQSVNDYNIYGLYVYTVATGQVRLLSDPASQDVSDLVPEWSPDSSTLLFARYRHSTTTADIYTILPNGNELIQLTNTPLNEFLPTYSPDGTHIAYAVSDINDPSITVSIAVMDADGSEPRNLTSTISPFTYNPFWAKDSNSIFFFSATQNNEWDVYTINVDGSNPVNLTHDAIQQSDLALSPDGSQILFIGRAGIDGSEIDFYTMNIDGSNMTKHLNPHGKGRHPSRVKWHPDGQRISYNESHIYLLRLGAGAH